MADGVAGRDRHGREAGRSGDVEHAAVGIDHERTGAGDVRDGIEGCRYQADLDRLADDVIGTVASGDMVIVMGAGSIERVAKEIIVKLQGRESERAARSDSGEQTT